MTSAVAPETSWLARLPASASPFDLLKAALGELGDELRIACSFGVEDMIVLHEAARAGRAIGRSPRVFLLDTGRLHQETYDLVDRARERYQREWMLRSTGQRTCPCGFSTRQNTTTNVPSLRRALAAVDR